MTLRLRTFGAVYLERDSTPLGGAHSQRRRLALLVYLAAANGAAITRAKLITLLWPESDEASGRHSLSQLLYSLRHDLGADTIVIDSETVRLNASLLPSDIQSFDDAVRAGRLEDVADIYRGAFLDGFHVDEAPELDRWLDEQRTRCARHCARALERLADAAAKAGDAHRALDWWRRRAVLDPSDGRVTLRLMQALTAVGDREGALRAARVYEMLLRDELEAEPDVDVTRLAAELRRGIPGARTPTAPNVAISTPPDAAGVAPPAASLPAASIRSTREWSRALPWRVTLGLAAVAAIVLAAVRQLGGDDSAAQMPAAAAAGTTVVVGDLEGPDSMLALAVREALRAELTNTRGVILTSDQGIRELKTLMRLPRDSSLRTAQLLALALRGGAHVAVSGSVLPVGSGWQIVLEVLQPASGRAITTFAERPINAEAILPAVGRLGRQLGDAISRVPRDPTIRALPAVTTASLPALKSYALARQLAASGYRDDAVAPGERAVSHDSTFVLAHYFLGDLLWFIDQQTHSEAHLTKAYDLLATVPPREQLVIRARYEQLVRDRPDSALVYWELLHDASPGDVLAYEGRAWALRALGRHEEAAASADTAMRLDPAAVAPNTNNVMYSLLGVGDTVGALDVARRVAPRNVVAIYEARFFAAHYRGDMAEAVRLADSARFLSPRTFRRQLALLGRGDLASARLQLDSMRMDDRAQVLPNALLNQGWTELALGVPGPRAAPYAQEALAWTKRRDLSPPAVGRLAERIADVAARAGDETTVRGTIALVRERDAGRSLRTYVLAQRTLDAALAYVLGNYDEAARKAAEARRGVYFSRSLATIAQLEADARRAAGQLAAADSLDRLVATHQIVDGHFEAWAMLRAAGALRARGRSTVTASR